MEPRFWLDSLKNQGIIRRYLAVFYDVFCFQVTAGSLADEVLINSCNYLYMEAKIVEKLIFWTLEQRRRLVAHTRVAYNWETCRYLIFRD